MKLGLVRHFKVITDEKNLLTSKEFAEAMNNYDVAPVRPNGLKINSDDWDICYCSTLPRAITTAEKIYDRKIIKSDLIKEVPISPFTKLNIKLPLSLWHIAARIAWFYNHRSQAEGIGRTKDRTDKFYNIISNSGYEKILIVAHGYFLHNFVQAMKKKGFKGDVDINIKNAKLYTITK
jgi:broad specificity phosphatase PhoE